MTLTINGKDETLEASELSILKLLELKDVEMPDMVSVQINGEILDRGDFESKTVQTGDKVEFLYFMGGGR